MLSRSAVNAGGASLHRGGGGKTAFHSWSDCSVGGSEGHCGKAE